MSKTKIASKEQNYYVKRQGKLVKEFRKFLHLITPKLVEFFGEKNLDIICQDMQSEFIKVLPDLPYIGGSANNSTANLLKAAWILGIQRGIAKTQIVSVEQISHIFLFGVSQMLDKMPRPIKFLIRNLMFSKLAVKLIQIKAKKSKLGIFKYNWIFDIQRIDKKTVYIDYYQCGINLFLTEQNAKELIGCLCATDYITFSKLGLKLVRTKTLAQGCECCNFKIYKDADK